VPASAPAPVSERRRPWRTFAAYTAGSLVATGCSELAILVCYGLLGLSPAVSSTIAWLCGAVPNYWLNRRWAWRRTDRPSWRREVLPYVVIILATLALAIVATRAVDAALSDTGSLARTAVVGATFLGVYVVMFVLRFLLLDRLFRRLDRTDVPRSEEGQ
jgi:putative flippase GtrA